MFGILNRCVIKDIFLPFLPSLKYFEIKQNFQTEYRIMIMGSKSEEGRLN